MSDLMRELGRTSADLVSRSVGHTVTAREHLRQFRRHSKKAARLLERAAVVKRLEDEAARSGAEAEARASAATAPARKEP